MTWFPTDVCYNYSMLWLKVGKNRDKQVSKKWVESRGRSWDRWSKTHHSHQPTAQTGYTCTNGVRQKAQGEITILQMCMSGAALRWNDLCHVCGTTCGWWPHQQQPRAALVQTVLDCLRKKSWLWLFSFSDFPCPALDSGYVQSQLLNPGLWMIRHHLTPSMTNSSAPLSHTLHAPWRGQRQMSRGLYSLRFCRLNQVGWVSSSPRL